MSDLVSSVERKKLVGEIASVLPADFEPISIISLSLPLSLFFFSLSLFLPLALTFYMIDTLFASPFWLSLSLPPSIFYIPSSKPDISHSHNYSV